MAWGSRSRRYIVTGRIRMPPAISATEFVEVPTGRVLRRDMKSAGCSAEHPPARFGRSITQMLTSREHDVLVAIASGLTSRETGQWLTISPRTVDVHRAKILIKLGARSSAEAVRIAMAENYRSKDSFATGIRYNPKQSGR